MNLPIEKKYENLEPLPWVQGPNGEKLYKNDLPEPPGPGKRFVLSIKAKIVLAVQGDLITSKEAIEHYNLSEEELTDWILKYSESGLDGLKVKKRQPKRVESIQVPKDLSRDLPKDRVNFLRIAKRFLKGEISGEKAISLMRDCPHRFEHYIKKYKNYMEQKKA